MSDTVIKVENLSKRYLVGHRAAARESYVTLRDTIVHEARNFGRKALDLARGRQIVQGDEIEEYWALKDVSFEVKRGEVVGLIGRNGAGKSTLLKILSRITEPTAGRVELRGRVASLLEVGTGFHPELTGRENIFLNGAILGMTQREIRRKFDEIVAFAEVERFLDTPVKRYSSGMYVRLAFAVAAHLEPEILIVDEVLAVGDAEFQKKCLGKMKDVAGNGRTVLFVSHNLNAVAQLCQNSVLLKHGTIAFNGTTSQALQTYKSATLHSINDGWRRPNLRDNTTAIGYAHASAPDNGPLLSSSPTVLMLRYRLAQQLHGPHLSVGIMDSDGHFIFTSNPGDAGLQLPREPGLYEARIVVPANTLLPKTYGLRISLWTKVQGAIDNVEDLTLEVLPGNSTYLESNPNRLGQVTIPCAWNLATLYGESEVAA